jgi:hypothetical protein
MCARARFLCFADASCCSRPDPNRATLLFRSGLLLQPPGLSRRGFAIYGTLSVSTRASLVWRNLIKYQCQRLVPFDVGAITSAIFID